MAECVILNSGDSPKSDECTASTGQVLSGYTAVTKDSDDEVAKGTMPDRGAYQWAGRGGHSTDCGFGQGVENGVEYYAFNNIPDGYYHNQGDSWSPELRLERTTVRDYLGISAGKIAKGQKIADIGGTYTSDATAAASDLRSGKTAYVNGTKISGSLATLAAVDKYVSAVVDQGNLWVRINSGIHDQNSVAGYPEVYMPQADLANVIGLTANKIAKGSSVLGIAGTFYGNVRGISAMAARGFDVSSSEWETYSEESFTMPANGLVIYGGCNAGYAHVSKCQILKNGTVVDSRDTNGSDYYYGWRGTMRNKSFYANAGDVIKVVCEQSSGTHGMSVIQATIIY